MIWWKLTLKWHLRQLGYSAISLWFILTFVEASVGQVKLGDFYWPKKQWSLSLKSNYLRNLFWSRNKDNMVTLWGQGPSKRILHKGSVIKYSWTHQQMVSRYFYLFMLLLPACLRPGDKTMKYFSIVLAANVWQNYFRPLCEFVSACK